jgi:hypothetical protein
VKKSKKNIISGLENSWKGGMFAALWNVEEQEEEKRERKQKIFISKHLETSFRRVNFAILLRKRKNQVVKTEEKSKE